MGACYQGNHFWSMDSYNALGMIDSNQACDCGQLTWREWQRIIHNRREGLADDAAEAE